MMIMIIKDASIDSSSLDVSLEKIYYLDIDVSIDRLSLDASLQS